MNYYVMVISLLNDSKQKKENVFQKLITFSFLTYVISYCSGTTLVIISSILFMYYKLQ